MSIQDYREFIASKAVSKSTIGMVPIGTNGFAKAHQTAAIEFALNAGKSASFLDTGLGRPGLDENKRRHRCPEFKV